MLRREFGRQVACRFELALLAGQCKHSYSQRFPFLYSFVFHGLVISTLPSLPEGVGRDSKVFYITVPIIRHWLHQEFRLFDMQTSNKHEYRKIRAHGALAEPIFLELTFLWLFRRDQSATKLDLEFGV